MNQTKRRTKSSLYTIRDKGERRTKDEKKHKRNILFGQEIILRTVFIR